MAFPQGINFRLTAAFVTDVAPDDVYEGTSPAYPHVTVQGNTVGIEGVFAVQFRNRNAGNDARIAGMMFNDTGDVEHFRVDLPGPGDYLLRCASGDASYACNTDLEVLDDAASLGNLSSTPTTIANSFRDATDTEYTAANWPGSNTAVSKTFVSSICRFVLPASDGLRLAHIRIDQVTDTALYWLPQGQTAGAARDQMLPSGMTN